MQFKSKFDWKESFGYKNKQKDRKRPKTRIKIVPKIKIEKTKQRL